MNKKDKNFHIGIIMDGNGRWAEMRGLPRYEGHKRGVERVKEIVNVSVSYGIDVLSLYAFSLENWMRPHEEITVIMKLLEKTINGEFMNFIKEGIRFKVIGNRERLSPHILNAIESLERATENNNNLILQCALSYGGRDEIVRAARKIATLKIPSENITEETFSKLLDTANIADPDLIIRTSGELRISNFLTWQAAYSEFYFTETLWPDFTKEELFEAIQNYRTRDRRFGKVKRGIFA
ncbi:MAG TPA: di-trans,poly-cis-decaprenylcistransferase [Nitrospirae bacterium]|nr:di-trans,poly-cis-decaprenylcistransferase [Nitrospirota bacterium]